MIFGSCVLTSSETAENYVSDELPPQLLPKPRSYFWKPPASRRVSSSKETLSHINSLDLNQCYVFIADMRAESVLC